jgi:nitrous oxide reductase
MAMVEDMTLGADIDGQGIMAFANLQVNVKDHDLGNTNEREKVVAIEVERVEALIKALDFNSDLDDATLLSDHDS